MSHPRRGFTSIELLVATNALSNMLGRMNGKRHPGTLDLSNPATNAAFCDGHAMYVVSTGTFPNKRQPYCVGRHVGACEGEDHR